MTTAEDNRKRMPGVAAIVDEVRKYFPGAKVIYAREGDIEVGKRPERTGIIPSDWALPVDCSTRSGSVGKNVRRR